MGPIRSPEIPVPNQPTLCNIPEEEVLRVNRSGSLRSRKKLLGCHETEVDTITILKDLAKYNPKDRV